MAGEDADDSPDDAVYPQFAIPIGLTFGLLLTAVSCLVVAWLNREPWQAFEPDPGAISSMLVRTTVIVSAGAALVLGCVIVGGLWQRRSRGFRRRFVAYLAPTFVVAGVTGWLLRDAGATGAAFEAAAKAQAGLGSLEPTVMAAVAWCCACAAVIVLAVVCRLGYVRPDSPEPVDVARHHRHPLTAVAVAVILAASVTPVAVVQAQQRSFDNSTASAEVANPAVAPLTGEVAYEVAAGGIKEGIAAAGPGFVAVNDAQSDAVTGFDGATGDERWRFSVAGSGFYGLASAGRVAVADGSFRIYGFDATTGAVLWMRREAALDPRDPQRTVGAKSVLVSSAHPEPPGPTAAASGVMWTALSPFTGEELWRRGFRYKCAARVDVTDTAVLMRSCEDGPDVLANVLDPMTGETRRVLTAAGLGPAAPDTDFRLVDAVSDTALVATGQRDTVLYRVVDLSSGAVLATLPVGRSASLLDARSLLLTDADGGAEQILDLDTNRTIETGVTGEYLGELEAGWRRWVRYGSEWVTFAAGSLRVVGSDGTRRTLPVPVCGETVAPVAAVAGAVLIDCDGRLLAIR